MELVTYAITGIIAGIIAGLFGVGGGLVIVPVLLMTFRASEMDESIVMHLAVGSSLATIIVTAISSIRAHHRRGAVLWNRFLDLTPGILIGGLLGAWIASLLNTDWLQSVFGIFVILVGLQLGLNPKVTGRSDLPARSFVAFAGVIIGAISAIVGIGGGSMTVPYLVWHRIPMIKAVATSAACGFPIAISGTLGFVLTGWGKAALPAYTSGYLYWPAIIGIGVMSVLSAPLGARIAHALPVIALKRLFAVLLILIGLRLLFG